MESATPTLSSDTRVLSLGTVVESTLVGLAGFLLASVVAASDGGYFSDSWAWLALVSLVAATLRLILVPSLPFRRLDWAFLAGLSGFAGWVALSTLWAPAATPTVNETIRDVSYTAIVLALLLIVRRRSVEALLVGTLLGVTAISGYSLLTRLRPDLVGTWDPVLLFRLSGPIGYWNGLGIYAAMGVVLGLGLSARSSHKVTQALAGAAPVVLLPTVLFTFSRGAWLGLVVGLVVVLVIDTRRLQLIATGGVLAVAPALVLAYAWRSDLIDSTITVQQAADEGRALIPWIVVLAIASAAAVMVFRALGERIALPTKVHRVAGGVLVAGAAVAIVLGFTIYGAPWTLAERAADSFNSRARDTGANATERLIDLSSDGRVEQWRVSIDQFEGQPLVGAGAGSYADAWNLHRTVERPVQDAHSLYVEALGELGIVGLLVLVAALGIPLAAAVHARRHPLVVGSAATYAAFLAHAGVDWDWELAGVTLVGLISAAALVVIARGDDVDTPPSRPLRLGLPLATGVFALIALAAVLSTVPLNRSTDAYETGNFAEAATQAQKAVDWAPWSSEALDALGRAQLAQAHVALARASFESAVAKSPNDWVLWRDLSAASTPVRAREALRQAQALNPLESELKQLQAALTPK